MQKGRNTFKPKYSFGNKWKYKISLKNTYDTGKTSYSWILTFFKYLMMLLKCIFFQSFIFTPYRETLTASKTKQLRYFLNRNIVKQCLLYVHIPPPKKLDERQINYKAYRWPFDDINHIQGYQIKISHFVQSCILFFRAVFGFKKCKHNFITWSLC